jgi:hypothetical protein
MGMDDHIQRIYPEDSIAAQGSYLIIRSYPEYTSRRLAIARSSSSNDVPHKFSDVYAIPNVDQLKPEDKGEVNTIGLWMFATDAKEHMIDVIQRYVKVHINHIMLLIQLKYLVCIRTSNKMKPIPKNTDTARMDTHLSTCNHPLQLLQNSVIYQTYQSSLHSNTSYRQWTVVSLRHDLPPQPSLLTLALQAIMIYALQLNTLPSRIQAETYPNLTNSSLN